MEAQIRMAAGDKLVQVVNVGMLRNGAVKMCETKFREESGKER